MSEPIAQIADVLRTFATLHPPAIVAATPLGSLGIDRLDLPMIMLDIEDRLDAPVLWEEGIEDAATVGDLLARVEAGIAVRSARIAQRAVTPRVKRSWVSTTAEQSR